MTKKDYILIAAAFVAAKHDACSKEDSRAAADMCDGADLSAEFLAESLQRDNSRFDRAKFLAACGAQS